MKKTIIAFAILAVMMALIWQEHTQEPQILDTVEPLQLKQDELDLPPPVKASKHSSASSSQESIEPVIEEKMWRPPYHFHQFSKASH